MPDVLIQKYFYPAVAEWLGESKETVEEMAEQYTDDQILSILAKNVTIQGGSVEKFR